MLISDQKSFIFFAINKTASSSIQTALQPYQNTLFYYWLRLQYKIRMSTKPAVFKHARPMDIRELIDSRRWQTYWKFCFVRNPFDRLVSLYFYQKHISRAARHPAATQLNFEQWLLSGGSGSARRSMNEFICDESAAPIVDFVGRYETLEQDFETICNHLAIEAKLPHMNRSRHTHYSVYYTDRARQEVERRFARDLEIFNYRFEENTAI